MRGHDGKLINPGARAKRFSTQLRQKKVNGAKCDVNVITSLEDKNQRPDLNKIRHVKNGNTYAIPKYDANFKQWSGITHKPIRGVPLSRVQDIGKKQIKRKHKFYVGKFFK